MRCTTTYKLHELFHQYIFEDLEVSLILTVALPVPDTCIHGFRLETVSQAISALM